jgi:hypothetical protein
MWTPKKKLLLFRGRSPTSLDFLGAQLGQSVSSLTLGTFNNGSNLFGVPDPGQVILVVCGSNSGSAGVFTSCVVAGLSAALVTPSLSSQNSGAVFVVAAPRVDRGNITVTMSSAFESSAIGVWRAVWHGGFKTDAVANNSSSAQSLVMAATGVAVGVAGAASVMPSFSSGLTNRGSLSDAFGYGWQFGDTVGALPGTLAIDASGTSYPLLAAASFAQV